MMYVHFVLARTSNSGKHLLQKKILVCDLPPKISIKVILKLTVQSTIFVFIVVDAAAWLEEYFENTVQYSRQWPLCVIVMYECIYSMLCIISYSEPKLNELISSLWFSSFTHIIQFLYLNHYCFIFLNQTLKHNGERFSNNSGDSFGCVATLNEATLWGEWM